ncbi:DNA repair protein RadC [Pseudomonas sp. Y39-6]|uniref:RadC family protein n=1 Tax=Pseudomonas sp. Y39-6 TaxID=2749807 RepID=UPI001910E7EF|nr:DNA repair protein RadC [Pseudomonas sp. Y39-6]QPO21970.1 DNA repair protein RadC [Pseudomonas sp. Y39-6]URS59284.1 DNA repair protein RadC [Pseudomonas sp. Y39-6]
MSHTNALSTAALSTITCREDEDQLIETALQILDRRLFTRGPKLEDPHEVRNYLKLQLAGMDHEVFAVIYLDSVHRPIKFEVLFHGSISSAVIHPRQVIKRALAHNAAAIIIAHNHPSGCHTPSLADRRLTACLKKSLELVEVRVLDHFIIAEGTPLSLAEYGWL